MKSTAALKSLQSRHVDKTNDLNPLETGFIGGALDGCASFTCSFRSRHNHNLCHWAIRVHSQNAEFIAALRIMTGTGEFLEVSNKKQIFWTLGALNGYFIVTKVFHTLQAKHHQARLLMAYREQSLIATLTNHHRYAQEMKKFNRQKKVVLKDMDDLTFTGYFLALFDAKGSAMMTQEGPILSLGGMDIQILKAIGERLNAQFTNNSLIWYGEKAFNAIYELTEGKLFALQKPMIIIKKMLEGSINMNDYKPLPPGNPKKKRRKLNTQEIKTLLDEFDKNFH